MLRLGLGYRAAKGANLIVGHSRSPWSASTESMRLWLSVNVLSLDSSAAMRTSFCQSTKTAQHSTKSFSGQAGAYAQRPLMLLRELLDKLIASRWTSVSRPTISSIKFCWA